MDLYSILLHQISSGREDSCYLLLNCAGLPGIYSRLRDKSLLWESLFKGTADLSSEEVGPVIILVGSEKRVLISKLFLDRIEQSGLFTSSIVLLSTPLNIEVLRERLTERLNVSLEGGFPAMLRFFDPRVLEALTRHLNSAQRDWFFGVASAWWYVNRLGETIKFATKFCESSGVSRQMQLTQSQEDGLLGEAEIDQIVNLLRSNFSEKLKISAVEQYRLVIESIAQCRSDDAYSVHNVACRVVELMLSSALNSQKQ